MMEKSTLRRRVLPTLLAVLLCATFFLGLAAAFPLKVQAAGPLLYILTDDGERHTGSWDITVERGGALTKGYSVYLQNTDASGTVSVTITDHIIQKYPDVNLDVDGTSTNGPYTATAGQPDTLLGYRGLLKDYVGVHVHTVTAVDVNTGVTSTITINLTVTGEGLPETPPAASGPDYYERHYDFGNETFTALKELPDSGSVTVDLPTSITYIPHFVFDQLYGTNKTLYIRRDGYTFRINGAAVPEEMLGHNQLLHGNLDGFIVP